MTTTILQRFLVRGGTAAALAALNEVPLARELVIETDTGKAKQGNGTTDYNSLPYIFTDASAEFVRDVIGAALVAGTGMQIVVNDSGDTITVQLASGYALPRTGTGSPAGVVSAPVGTLYLRTDGSTGTTLYVKETGGTGNTGWVAK